MAHFSHRRRKDGQIVTVLHNLKYRKSPPNVSTSTFRELAHILLYLKAYTIIVWVYNQI